MLKTSQVFLSVPKNTESVLRVESYIRHKVVLQYIASLDQQMIKLRHEDTCLQAWGNAQWTKRGVFGLQLIKSDFINR